MLCGEAQGPEWRSLVEAANDILDRSWDSDMVAGQPSGHDLRVPQESLDRLRDALTRCYEIARADGEALTKE